MTERREFCMSEEDYAELLRACQPVPMIALQCGPVMSTQGDANAAWDRLGRKMGFHGGTAMGVHGKGGRYFTAIPVETPNGEE